MAEQETAAQQQKEDDKFKTLAEDIAAIKKHLGLDKKKPTNDEVLRSRKRQ